MTFIATSGSMTILNPAGEVVFDSAEKLFTCTNYVTGSISIPARGAMAAASGGYSTDVDVDTVLAAVNPIATHVFGSFKVTVSSAQHGVSGLGWFGAGGTYVHEYFSTQNGNISVYCGYTFLCNAGSLIFNERASVYPIGFGTTNVITVNPSVIDYKVYCGSFV